MIPSDVRLYTWVDVEEVFLCAQQEGDWPEWLVWARAYWDSLTLGILLDKQDEALKWLSRKFDPRFDAKQALILLESIQEKPRQLKVLFEETTDKPSRPRFTPRLARPSVLLPHYEPEHPATLASDLPPVVAFHSFKGGVGRTLLTLALAKGLVEQGKRSRVLLVDGDLEAPGLTWLLDKRFPHRPISFVDFLALVHGDPTPTAEDSIELVADRVRDMFLEGIYVLPAFRSVGQFTSLEVKPEHLIQGAEDPFILTTMLAKLGKSLDVRAVILDLRAGLSELSTGLLLDPRVYRVLVTTLSSQSIEGTRYLLELLGKLAPSKQEEEPLPAFIISQVPDDFRKGDLVAPYEERLLEAAKPFLEDAQENDTPDLPHPVSYFDPNLTVLPDTWDEVMRRLRQSNLIQQISPLIDWLPGLPLDEAELQINVEELKQKREQLAQFAKSLIYAEIGDIEDFLSIPPLNHLASDFSAKVPIAVIVGAKGSGKTYTFLQTVRRATWQTFVRDAGIPQPSIAAAVCPVLKSRNLHKKANTIVQETEQKTAKTLGLSSPRDIQSILDHLRDNLKTDLHEGQWRDLWLNVIAWRAGFEVGRNDAGRRFADYLREKRQFVVAVMDGLEDLFQNLTSEKNEQTALRSLLQEVPDWLEQQPSRPIGLLIFACQDLVLNAVRQNSAQLMARYEPYALRWSPEEALRLVAWITIKGPLELPIEQLQEIQEIQEMSERDLVDKLVPLWGRKLGRPRSREGRSAEWVIAALSDFKGQIQARDLVRFLHEAAQASVGDKYWKDRLLVPQAIRNAVKKCSEKKIEEIGIENKRLGAIFDNLRSLSEDARQIPFTQEQVGLDRQELKTLEENGVVLREGEEYYMPEIFRWGLNFKLKTGVRPRVLTLSRRTRK